MKLTARQHEIIAAALQLYADDRHLRATELHRANMAKQAGWAEDNCGEALDLAQALARLQRAGGEVE